MYLCRVEKIFFEGGRNLTLRNDSIIMQINQNQYLSVLETLVFKMKLSWLVVEEPVLVQLLNFLTIC